ncbi:helix-turn-helix domain-containing protein [Maribacter sp. Asnod1-A12]|uniref:helix-turn-helix domain-containing protein n=1 Tax=Maribacter sp. Asnod1-A12 TaxID=3160576 RepID=UPI00386B5130
MKGHIRNDKLLLKISNRLKTLRFQKGVTQEEVYNETGVHISRIEAGKSNISVTTLHRLCIYFEIDLVEFFTFMK